MGAPIDIGRVFGVYLRIEVWVFLMAAFFVMQGLERPGLGGALDELTFAILLIFSIYLHEMGHAFGARLFGIGTLDVTLTFFGGYARLTRQARTTTEEVVVSGSGPATNLLLWYLLSFWLLPLANLSGHSEYILYRVASANLFLGLFNLLPGYPLDGGNIATAILARFMRRGRARLITGYIGMGVGGLLVALDVMTGNFSFNAMIGIMLIYWAWQEVQSAQNSRF
jgi:Zn-dependent protease